MKQGAQNDSDATVTTPPIPSRGSSPRLSRCWQIFAPLQVFASASIAGPIKPSTTDHLSTRTFGHVGGRCHLPSLVRSASWVLFRALSFFMRFLTCTFTVLSHIPSS